MAEELQSLLEKIQSDGIARAEAEHDAVVAKARKEAQEIVTQTMEGAMRLLAVNGQEPETEINKVTTPGGLTLKGLDAMEATGFSNSVKCGLFASIKK